MLVNVIAMVAINVIVDVVKKVHVKSLLLLNDCQHRGHSTISVQVAGITSSSDSDSTFLLESQLHSLLLFNQSEVFSMTDLD